MNTIRQFVKILSHLCVIAMVAGMAVISLYLSLSKLLLIIPALGLLTFEFHTGSSKTSSSTHFSAAVALFFAIFYLSLFGATRPEKENVLAFGLLTSAIWLIGRFGFLLGRALSKNQPQKTRPTS